MTLILILRMNQNLTVTLIPNKSFESNIFQWANFTNTIQRYEMDIWLYDNNPDLSSSISRTMEGIPDLLLLHEMLIFHEKSQQYELTDDWLAQSQIGLLLRVLNVRILAVVERAILGEVNEENGEHIRCSLLVGPL